MLAKYAPQLPPDHLWTFIGLIAYVGAGITLMNVSLINVLVFSVPPRSMGIATGSNSLFRNFGSTWGPAIAGTVMSTYYVLFHPPGAPASVQIKIPTARAYEVLFGTSAGIFLLLAFLVLAVREVMKGGRIHEVENGEAEG
ncbi:hypothetical protein [Thermococcus sp. P6]|uniref:hypothetical protein n=1 Tax=Thermococcus sp. P6 TaxID=122420 RepID=UPI001E43F938|nr:hypothetical protein [Thermococcus sp. P6]